MHRRKLMAYALATLGLAGRTARAQSPAIANIADVAGTWHGRVEPIGLKLKLTLQPDGRFDLSQTLQMEINSAGKAYLKNGALALPLPVGDTILRLTPEGKLTGLYTGERVKGTATLAKD